MLQDLDRRFASARTSHGRTRGAVWQESSSRACRIGARGGARIPRPERRHPLHLLHLSPLSSRIHWHRQLPVAMPRSLARLRYRAPPAPITFSRIDGARPLLDSVLEKRVAAYVVRQSNPRHVKLQVVVNQKAKQQATGKFVPPPMKPYTLRDIVDPEGTARHGEIIYIFRNIKTNQIIYSLQELLDVRPSCPVSCGSALTCKETPPRTTSIHWQTLETRSPAPRRMDTTLRPHIPHP